MSSAPSLQGQYPAWLRIRAARPDQCRVSWGSQRLDAAHWSNFTDMLSSAQIGTTPNEKAPRNAGWFHPVPPGAVVTHWNKPKDLCAYNKTVQFLLQEDLLEVH